MDQVKEKRNTWVPLKKTNKIKNKQTKRQTVGSLGRERGKVRNFFFFLFSSFLSHIYKNRTVRILRIKNESVLRDEGYAWVPKTRDFS